jgi:hypothetical protein
MLRIILSGPTVLFKELQKEENIFSLEDELKYSLNMDFIEVKTEGIVKPVNPDAYKREVHVLGTALTYMDEIKSNREMFLKVIPERLAGLPLNASDDERLEYMTRLLDGLDYELCARLLGGDDK